MKIRLASTSTQLDLSGEDLVRAGITLGSPVVVEADGPGRLLVREQTSAEMDAEVAAGGRARASSVEELFRKLGA